MRTLLASLFSGVAMMSMAEPVLVLDIAAEAGDGTVEIELRPDLAPQHVERILELTRQGAYDGIVFHRVIDDFMAQTGDVEFGKRDGESPNLAGTGGSDLPDLPAEFTKTPFDKGVVGMARASDVNSANAQFFIMFNKGYFLNGQYTVIGVVKSGQDVVDRIKRGDAAENGLVSAPADYIRDASILGEAETKNDAQGEVTPSTPQAGEGEAPAKPQ